MLPQLQLRLKLGLGTNSWPGNYICFGVAKKKKEKRKKKNTHTHFFKKVNFPRELKE